MIYGVNLRIQSEYRKIRTIKTPHLDTFHAVVFLVIMYRVGDGIPPSFNLCCDSDVVKEMLKKFDISINKLNPYLGGLLRGLVFGACVYVCVCVLNSVGLCLKIEIWYVCIHRYVFSENITFRAGTPLILLMSAFFRKKSAFLAKIVLLLQAIV